MSAMEAFWCGHNSDSVSSNYYICTYKICKLAYPLARIIHICLSDHSQGKDIILTGVQLSQSFQLIEQFTGCFDSHAEVTSTVVWIQFALQSEINL